jgi:hypothetical protein
MSRLASAAALLLVAGCAFDSSGPRRPSSGPPEAPSGSAPPPAWIEAGGRTQWLGYSTYCWGGGEGVGQCVDYTAPSCRGPNAAPPVLLTMGMRARLHLGFRVTEPVRLTVLGNEPRGGVVHEATLSATANPDWLVEHPAGPMIVFARGAQGDASYAACVRLR